MIKQSRYFALETMMYIILHNWLYYRRILICTYILKKFLLSFCRFAVSDNAYRALIEENRGQCILISGKTVCNHTVYNYKTNI